MYPRACLALTCLVLTLVAGTAQAQPSDPSPSRAVHAEGTALFDAGKFTAAATKFEEAFALENAPSYLLDIGHAYRRAGRCAKAGAAYRSYVERQPEATDAPQVRALVDEMTGCVLFDEGRALMKRGQPADACKKFAAAFDENPSAIGTQMNLGLCNEKLGKLATARRWFRNALERAKDSDSPEAETVARQRIDALAARVPTLAIVVSPSSSERAQVRVDGEQVASLDSVELDPGRHVVEVGSARRDVSLAEGQRKTLMFESDPPPSVSANRARLFGLVGGGLVLGSGALGYAGRWRTTNSSDLETRRRWRSIVRYGGTSMFVVGTASIGYALVLYLRRDRAPARERASVIPAATSDHVGLVVTGEF